MPQNLPKLGQKKASTSDRIIELLGEEWPLSAKGICGQLHRKMGSDMTYQAVHKKLKEMENDKILIKKENRYQLNLEWVQTLRETSERIEKSYLSGSKNVFQTDHFTVSFDNLFDFYKNMLIALESGIFLKGGDKIGFGIMQNMWWPLSFEAKYFEMFKSMSTKFEAYVLCTQTHAVNKWLIDYYSKAGFTGVKFGCDYKTNCDLFVQGNTIGHIYFADDLMKWQDKLYSETKDVSDLINENFYEKLFNKKSKITVIASKDEILAKQLCKKVLGAYFSIDELGPIAKKIVEANDVTED